MDKGKSDRPKKLSPLPRYSPDNKETSGWMNLTEAAAFLNVSAKTLRSAVDAGELRAEHPLSDGPWLFHRQELVSSAAQRVKERAHKGGRRCGLPAENQCDLQFSST